MKLAWYSGGSSRFLHDIFLVYYIGPGGPASPIHGFRPRWPQRRRFPWKVCKRISASSVYSKCIFSGIIEIDSVIKEDENDKWFTLDNAKHGKIHLRFTWLGLAADYTTLGAVITYTYLLYNYIILYCRIIKVCIWYEIINHSFDDVDIVIWLISFQQS